MRELNSHKVNPANDKLTVLVHDEPGSGGAHHQYSITLPDQQRYHIDFQNGPIAEAGVNGLTHEALLAILIDRLECFQKGNFANSYNQRALEHMVGAQESLKDRTRERMTRGVEGRHTV
jgi:hypothetical protein